jgi:methionine-S-sulfoxide reductase/methionine-R-sulfoxide reductase
MPKQFIAKIKNLNPLEFVVTQKHGTETPFQNQYWDNKQEGIYVDIISGDPLFSSLDKFDSGTGWPSFCKALAKSAIILEQDLAHGLKRTEVATLTTHLGHLFEDGPENFGGLRYCINSVSLKFIAKDNLIELGYGEYLSLFSNEVGAESEYAYLAGGCFWGLEHFLSKANGIINTKVGYCGGDIVNPSYEQVSRGNTGYAETVEVKFNPKEITYREILKLFFTIHDPTTLNKQSNDLGTQYRSAIFYSNNIQKYTALNIIELANQSNVFTGSIVTKVEEMKNFYQAEEYHQKYLEHNPTGYNCHFVRANWKF